MILFAFRAVGNDALFHRELARRGPRYRRFAGNTVEEGSLPSTGKTLRLPVVERLFG